MLLVIRLIIITIYCVLVCVFGSIYCLFSPCNPKHVATFSNMFGCLAPLLGLKVEKRLPKGTENFGNAIYIANHQNNYDMVTASNAVLSPTVTVGKKSLLWIPFFGQLYWLTGNLLIDRNNKTKAHNVVKKMVKYFKKRRISIWIFPEGTRNYGRGLLPFKTGAFRAAIEAKVPIIPVCISNTQNKINLNCLSNGLVIVEMLPPIDSTQYYKHQFRELAQYCHELMASRIAELDKEVAEREVSGNI